MFRLIRCSVLFNTKYNNQCIPFGTCWYHSTPILFRNNAQSVNVNQETSYQPVADFYAGKSVFLTGGTGFLGKVFIEKLLSNCPEIDKIYVLIRENNGALPEQRLKRLLQSQIFTKLKATKPEYIRKVVAIPGDINEPELGIKAEDEQTLINEVAVIFHSAAKVKFTEPLKEIIESNVEGTQKVLNLSQRMNKLEMLVYISTAYSNSDKRVIDEVVYPPPKKLEDVHYYIKNYGHDKEEVKKYIKSHSNTYLFSKSLAETLVVKNRGNVPTIIVRPSVVSPALRDPLSGWVDNWVGASAFFTEVARGIIRVVHGSNTVVIDMIPVDYVCNFTIAAAAKSPKSKEVIVYNSCTSSTNPITLKCATDLFVKESVKFGDGELPFPKMFQTKSPYLASVLTFLLETIPLFTADLWLKATGKKPKYIQLQQKSVYLREVLKLFTTNSFYIRSNNANSIISSMDENDRQHFACDPKTIDWKKYMPMYFYGLKQHLLSNKNNK